MTTPQKRLVRMRNPLRGTKVCSLRITSISQRQTRPLRRVPIWGGNIRLRTTAQCRARDPAAEVPPTDFQRDDGAGR
jgi:hypothetical protein